MLKNKTIKLESVEKHVTFIDIDWVFVLVK